MHMSKLVPVPHNHIGFTPYHLEIPRVYTVVPLEFSRIWGGGLTRILPLIASNWPVRQRHNAAKCFITAENNLNFEKWLKSSISYISSKVSTLKYKLLHESYLNAFASNLSRNLEKEASESICCFIIFMNIDSAGVLLYISSLYNHLLVCDWANAANWSVRQRQNEARFIFFWSLLIT